ncbi:asparaginase [Pseudoruegeria sp. SK021]|uniref:asparaginase n=1 Tax=Pseudoruegeria sp. SK021 TaxID=1933035 RepID=UPI000A262479|nr:asparaginase [Pseudoruegeria sp. SK021]OSP56449.1 L-asparaginase 1 [Pseudoruegeria sp. SK021]
MAILVVHTGGTIGMQATADGFAPQVGIVEDAVAELIAAGHIGTSVDIVRLEPLIDSAQATPQDWHRVAQAIHGARDAYDAVIVTHGTDTLAFTAAALCLALPGVAMPVIVTGSMLPLTVADSDGRHNLIDAFAAAATAPPGVWVQFAGRLLHGGRVRKAHSHARAAFEATPSPVPPMITAAQPGLVEVQAHRVSVLTVTPGFCADLALHAAATCDGVVLRCFGSGTAPDTPAMQAVLAKAWAMQVPVIAVSQCPEGGMKLGTYAAGKILRDGGVIDGRAMTADMAFVKMQFALSQFDEFEARRGYLGTDQCGEMLD